MSARRDPLLVDEKGLACPAGGFHVDPWQPVALAAITHAHADHARPGSERYLAAAASVPLLRRRLHPGARIDGLPYGEEIRLGGATVSFHPAGHVLGSAQVRIETGGEVWVASGDYKRAHDPTCAPFEPVTCDVFITEATFALPVFRWPSSAQVAAEIDAWWRRNRDDGRASVLFCYALGKAQRIMAMIGRDIGPVYLHGALGALVEVYRQAGIDLAPASLVSEAAEGTSFAGALVLAPPSAGGSTWMRRFGRCRTAFASGWMQVRKHRRARGVGRGFVLSDHADWPDLLRTVADSGASRVLATHGYADVLARYLREARGLDAEALATRFDDTGGEGGDDVEGGKGGETAETGARAEPGGAS